MEPHKILLNVLMFAIFIVGGLFILFGEEKPYQDADGIFNDYDVNMNSTQFAIMRDKVDETYNLSAEQKDEMIADEVSAELGWNNLITGPYKALQRMVKYFKLVGVVNSQIAKVLHIPAFFVTFFATGLIILVTFVIIYMVFRFQPRSR